MLHVRIIFSVFILHSFNTTSTNFFQVDRNLGAAVAMLGGSTGYSKSGINGVVRFVQINNDECIVDGTIDGLSPGKHGIHVYECGDLSNGCDRFE